MAWIAAAANFIYNAVVWVFTSNSIYAAAARFIAGSLISTALAGQSKSEGPRLSDLKIQTSTYGNPIPRMYGEAVRAAGNVIDKSDLIEIRKKKKKKMLGITVSSTVTYTYFAHLAVMLCEGELPADAVRRIWANGKLIFDRSARTSAPTRPDGTATDSTNLGVKYTRSNGAHSFCDSITIYPGSAVQTVNDTLQSLHGADDVPAYRHTAYVVFENMALADYGNGVPNLEFEYETNYPTVKDAVEHLASFADVTVNANALASIPLRGYIMARAGSVWNSLEPLAGAFSFDLITDGPDFRAKRRGPAMRTILSESDFAARPVGDGPKDTIKLKREDAGSYPDEITVTFMDASRDYQTNTARAFRNEGFARNKQDIELAVVFENGDIPRNIAQRTLGESLAAVNTTAIEVSEKFRWLEAGDLVGLPIDLEIYPFRLTSRNVSPNGVVSYEAVLEDVLAYDLTALVGVSGEVPDNELELPGETIFQPIDSPIVEDADDDTGFYFAATGGDGWRGAELDRADGTGSPLSYDFISDTVVPATIGDCVDTLASGPTDVWDNVNTVEVQLLGGDEPATATEADVLVRNLNLAWIGPPDGQGGEFINFKTVSAGGSPNTYILSGLLRGRYGTEYAVGAHGSGERFVLMNTSEVNRMDFRAIDWNTTNTYRAVSVQSDASAATPVEFDNTGEGKRPLAPVHLVGTRNGANNDVLLSWVRRSRLQGGTIAGPTPLGESREWYSLDIYNGASIVRTTDVYDAAEFNYTEAMQTADGNTLAAPVRVDIYQVSDVRGRGHVAQGTL